MESHTEQRMYRTGCWSSACWRGWPLYWATPVWEVAQDSTSRRHRRLPNRLAGYIELLSRQGLSGMKAHGAVGKPFLRKGRMIDSDLNRKNHATSSCQTVAVGSRLRPLVTGRISAAFCRCVSHNPVGGGYPAKPNERRANDLLLRWYQPAVDNSNELFTHSTSTQNQLVSRH